MNKANIEFTILGVPGSINHLYGQAKNGRRYIRQKGREYKQLVQNTLSNVDIPKSIFHGRLQFKFTIYFNSMRKRDLDNCLKILLDSLEGHLFEDDSQIDIFTMTRAYDKDNPRVEIQVENIT